MSTDSNTTLPVAYRDCGIEYVRATDAQAALSASESRVQALQREVEELRARMPNALRYEWLRSRYLRVFVADCHGSPVIDIECDDIEPVSESDGRRLDAEIDAASKAEVPNV